MEGKATETVLQYGAIGVVVAVLLTLFVWTVKTLVSRLISHLDRMEGFVQDNSKAILSLERTMTAFHAAIERDSTGVRRIRDAAQR